MPKKRFVAEATGHIVGQDDSGIVVDALNGRPGVRSKQYSEEGTSKTNNHKLLEEMADKTNRSARFQCAIAIVRWKDEKSHYRLL